MSDATTPKILTYRFHEFRPSDRQALKKVLQEKDGRDKYVSALRIYLQKWADSDWLTEYDLERIGQWTVTHCPDVAGAVRLMARSELASAQNEQAKKTYSVMEKSVAAPVAAVEH